MRAGIKASLLVLDLQKMNFDDFSGGQRFHASFVVSRDDFESYLAAAWTENIPLQGSAERQVEDRLQAGMIPGRSLMILAEAEIKRLEQFSGCSKLFCGMDGDQHWGDRQTRFVSKAYVGERLSAECLISAKTDHSNRYGILAIDFEINKKIDHLKPVVVSKKNVCLLKR